MSFQGVGSLLRFALPPTLVTLVVFSLIAAAVGQGGVATIDVADVKPGMKGYGLTVFRGTQPERFDVEVIDVTTNFRPGQDLILIRTPHPILDRAKIVAGMSGSPIYFDGKLAGAYAYGWTFGNDPVAGVTPIANMLKELARPLDPEIWKILGTFPEQSRALSQRRLRSAPHTDGLPPNVGGERRDALWALRATAPSRPEHPQLARAQTPLMLAGFSDLASDTLSRALDAHGLLPVQAGGGGARRAPKGTKRTQKTAARAATAGGYVDGGAIGVQLIRGDVSATAVGTVTHVAGRRLVAFGHPMMNAGQTAMPTSTANVIHIMSSLRRSFKMAYPLSPLGALVNDRQSAIVVDADVEAETIPVRLKVHGVPGAPQDEWHMEVASGRSLTPALVFAGLLNALQATVAGEHDVIYRAESRVEIPGHGTQTFTDVGHLPMGADGPLTLARLRAFGAIDAAYGNPFERARIGRVEIDLHLRASDDVAMIIDASVTHGEVDPGYPTDVYVTLQRYDGSTEVRRIPVDIPASAAGSKLDLEIASGDRVQPPVPKPRNLDDLLAGLQTGYQPTSLVVSTRLPSQGLQMRGHVAEHLPGSALDLLQSASSSSRPMTFSTQDRLEVPLDRVVYGTAKVQLEVREEALR